MLNIIFLAFMAFIYGMMFKDVFGGGFDDSSRHRPPSPPPAPKDNTPLWRRK